MGRWSVSGSEDTYVRSATRITENSQRVTAVHGRRAYGGGPDFFGEEETLAQLSNFLLAVGVSDEDMEAQLKRLACADISFPPDPLGSLTAAGVVELQEEATNGEQAVLVEQFPALDDLEDIALAQPLAILPEEDDSVLAEADILQLLALQDEEARVRPAGFVVSRTQGGRCRRLHFVGGCFRVPGGHFRHYDDYGQSIPEAHLYNARCKDCHPAGKAAARALEEEVEGSASDGSASSSSQALSAGAFAEDDAAVSPS